MGHEEVDVFGFAEPSGESPERATRNPSFTTGVSLNAMLPGMDWRERDKAIIDFFRLGIVVTYKEVQPLFPSRIAATKRLAKLYLKKKISALGFEKHDFGGRPGVIYGRNGSSVSPQLAMHALGLSRVLLRYPGAKVIVAPPDNEYRPDAILTLTETYYVEYDRDTENTTFLKKRFAGYVNCRNKVLWIVPSEARRQELMRNAEAVKKNSLFALESEVLATPKGNVWLGLSGKRWALV